MFDRAVVGMCQGPTIDLGCGPGRLVAHLVRRGIPALGVDQSATAVQLARRSGAPALHRDVFGPLPGTGRWHTVLLADGNVGLGGDPPRILARASELLRRGGRCLVEFDSAATGVRRSWVRLESAGGGGAGVGSQSGGDMTTAAWFFWPTRPVWLRRLPQPEDERIRNTMKFTRFAAVETNAGIKGT